MRVRRIAAFGVAIAALTLVACDGDDDSDSAAPEDPPASQSEPSSDPAESSPPSEPTKADATESAVERFEAFMHAYGSGDTETACEIGGDAIVAGLGDRFPCGRALTIGRRFNPVTVLAALRTATVDASKVAASRPDRVVIPRSAISKGADIFTSENDAAVMSWDGSDWFLSPEHGRLD